MRKEIMQCTALSRRRFAKAAAAAGLAMVTVPVIAKPAKSACGVTYFTWSGYDDPGFFPQYVKKHGSSPDMPVFADEQEALTKLRAGFVVDVAHPCSGRIEIWRDADVIEPIDTSRLSNWGDVFPNLKSINGADADGQQWFVPVLSPSVACCTSWDMIP